MAPDEDHGPVEALSAVTLLTSAMARSVRFYEQLGFRLVAGGPLAPFSTFRAGPSYLNLQLDPAFRSIGLWGRVIFFVDDVDATWWRATQAGLLPEAEPADAPWGERYFHLRDPDGHELSFARPLRPSSQADHDAGS